MKNQSSALILELDGVNSDTPAREIASRAHICLHPLGKAVREPASTRGRILRATGVVKLWIGTTGRFCLFGNPEHAHADVGAGDWRVAAKACTDALMQIEDFGNFLGRVDEIRAMTGGIQFLEAEKLVRKVRTFGGYPSEGVSSARTLGKVFHRMNESLEYFASWRKSVADAEAEVARVHMKEPELLSVDDVAIGMAQAIDEATPAAVQEERLQAVEAPAEVAADEIRLYDETVNPLEERVEMRVKEAVAAVKQQGIHKDRRLTVAVPQKGGIWAEVPIPVTRPEEVQEERLTLVGNTVESERLMTIDAEVRMKKLLEHCNGDLKKLDRMIYAVEAEAERAHRKF